MSDVMYPLVSVIIPAYNSESTVGRTIESVLAQTYPRREIIVINDGSSDGTQAAIQKYGDRIILLNQENLGQGAARNRGLERCSGDFIAFLDADDYWLPGFMEACVSFLGSFPEAIAVSTGIIVKLWRKPERRWPADTIQELPKEGCVIDNFFDFWGRHDHVRTGSVMIRREALQMVGPQRADLRISQDLEYWGYLATWGKWGLLPRHLWVGDPTPCAAQQGWKTKYSKRRELCPSIEQWEKRILPRLTSEQMPGFLKVRGRVAASFALSKIKGGATREAWNIVRSYEREMPSNWSTSLMRLGARWGGGARAMAVLLIQLREHYKSVSIGKTNAAAVTERIEVSSTPWLEDSCNTERV